MEILKKSLVSTFIEKKANYEKKVGEIQACKWIQGNNRC